MENILQHNKINIYDIGAMQEGAHIYESIQDDIQNFLEWEKTSKS